jgi:hypothetical protein
MHTMLFNLIVENNFKFFKDDLQFSPDKTTNFNFNKLIPLQKIVGEDLIFLVNSDIKTSFSFSNFCRLKNKKLVVKNLPLFWVV